MSGPSGQLITHSPLTLQGGLFVQQQYSTIVINHHYHFSVSTANKITFLGVLGFVVWPYAKKHLYGAFDHYVMEPVINKTVDLYRSYMKNSTNETCSFVSNLTNSSYIQNKTRKMNPIDNRNETRKIIPIDNRTCLAPKTCLVRKPLKKVGNFMANCLYQTPSSWLWCISEGLKPEQKTILFSNQTNCISEPAIQHLAF